MQDFNKKQQDPNSVYYTGYYDITEQIIKGIKACNESGMGLYAFALPNGIQIRFDTKDLRVFEQIVNSELEENEVKINRLDPTTPNPYRYTGQDYCSSETFFGNNDRDISTKKYLDLSTINADAIDEVLPKQTVKLDETVLSDEGTKSSPLNIEWVEETIPIKSQEEFKPTFENFVNYLKAYKYSTAGKRRQFKKIEALYKDIVANLKAEKLI